MDSPDTVLTLDRLGHWKHEGHKLAVLGHPIKHSISPAMHNAALTELAKTDTRFLDWKYFRFDVPPDDLPTALARLHDEDFTGLNLTVPHKVIAFGHVGEIDKAAQPIGAVNTLLRTPSGWRGYNTDGYGLATAIKETLGRELTDSPLILLGAGGAARGAAVECLQRTCASLWIANRTRFNLDALLIDLAPIAGKIPLHGFDPQNPPADLPADALVINATSAGMKPADAQPIDLTQLPKPAGVFDMIYNPPETRLLAQARTLGLPAANGLSMLIHQGARALEIWTGGPVPVEAMRTAATAALGR
ncbi:shikimate dehydrogenase [Nibricoccus aquaticus]|uniref:Shikimate dehydrogenase (NADP(+)) n=1 Tax=Nibricoccus aquaticus TaxID=2576891 RepID=A0A290QBU4_9BACT|nr:shikimate dehydrogenase [Nibricoccus aquaticus]ATC66165.1 shikimate dehydrogenase [Nibricoccus aquaticus]